MGETKTNIKQRSLKMKKSNWQYLVDTLLFICLVCISFIGFLMGFFLAQGPTAQEADKYFMGLHRHQWGNIHLYISIVFSILIIIHIIFDWKWIKGKAQKLFKKRWGVVLILTVIVSFLVLFLIWCFYPKYPASYEDYGKKAGERMRQTEQLKKGHQISDETAFQDEDQGYLTVTGQMTLLDVEKAFGIPARRIADKLGLPSKISFDDTLGRLRKRYSFTLVEVRAIITELLSKEKKSPEEKKESPEIQQITEEKIEHEKKEEKPRGEKEHEKKIARGRMEEDQSGILITGQMTLNDIENLTGIPARKIADKLGLPPSTPLNETLGRLRKRHLFTMQELRDVVASLIEKKH